MTAVWFVLAVGLGAAIRLRINRLGWGWAGTLLANAVGCFLLGWLIATDPSTATTTVIGTGFLGSLTTYSMVAIDASEGRAAHRLTVIVGNLLFGFAALVAGHALG